MTMTNIATLQNSDAMLRENRRELLSIGGLNDGNALDDDEIIDFLFESPIAGEVPELKHEIAVIVSTESHIQKLNYLLSDIEQAGGMCQAFALEAQALIPEFDDNRSSGYYTESPSATRYTVAVEEIYHKIEELVIKTVESALELVSQYDVRICMRTSFNVRCVENYANLLPIFERALQAYEQLERIYISQSLVLKFDDKNYGNFDQLIQNVSALKTFSERNMTKTPNHLDVIFDWKLAPAVRKAFSVFKSRGYDLITKKLELIKKVTKDDKSIFDLTEEDLSSIIGAETSGEHEALSGIFDVSSQVRQMTEDLRKLRPDEAGMPKLNTYEELTRLTLKALTSDVPDGMSLLNRHPTATVVVKELQDILLKIQKAVSESPSSMTHPRRITSLVTTIVKFSQNLTQLFCIYYDFFINCTSGVAREGLQEMLCIVREITNIVNLEAVTQEAWMKEVKVLEDALTSINNLEIRPE